MCAKNKIFFGLTHIMFLDLTVLYGISDETLKVIRFILFLSDNIYSIQSYPKFHPLYSGFKLRQWNCFWERWGS